MKRNLLALVLTLTACAPIGIEPTLTDPPEWHIDDQWTVETSHRMVMAMTAGDDANSWGRETFWDFIVDGTGTVDGVDAYRVRVSKEGHEQPYLRLYFRATDLGLLRVEEFSLTPRGGMKQRRKNLFGDGPAFPVVTANALVPYNFPVFDLPSGRYNVDAVIEGVGGFQTTVKQSAKSDGEDTVVTLVSDGMRIEQRWRTGEPWWSSQTVNGRSQARLVSFRPGYTNTDTGENFLVDTTADLSPQPMPLKGEALHVPWLPSNPLAIPNPNGEATGVWSGHWWPMLEGPGKRLLYSDDGPMAKYDEYVNAKLGHNGGTKDWEYANHRTTESNTSWWGHCNGWAASSVMADEPKTSGEGYGVMFTVGDKKGLLAESYNASGSALYIGRRHNGKRDDDGDITDDQDAATYKDVKPYDFHKTLVEWVGIQGAAVVLDVNPGYQVWNYPAYKYEMTTEPDPDHSDRLHVTAKVWTVGFSSPDFVGVSETVKTYTYWITVNSQGDPKAGPSDWTGSSVTNHPDFIWRPSGQSSENPITIGVVNEIMELGDSGSDDHPNRAGDTGSGDTIAPGNALAGSIESAGDIDYFTFDAEPGYSYTVETFDLGNGSDTYVYLIGPDGTTEITSDDDGGTGRASKVTLETPTGGSTKAYYVRVRHYSPSGTGSYKIKVGEAAAPVSGMSVPGSESNLSASRGEWLHFTIPIPADAMPTLVIKTSGGSGDSDLYVRYMEKPTKTTYDHRPYANGNNETVTLENAAGGNYFVALHAYANFAGVTLDISFGNTGGGGGNDSLGNGTSLDNLSGAAGEWRTYTLDVPPGASGLEVKMSGGSGDADLYVKHGSEPTESSYDHRPYLGGNNETVAIPSPSSGTYYVAIRGYQTYSNVRLQTSWSGGGVGNGGSLANGSPMSGLSGAAGEWHHFMITVPATASSLEVTISGGTGDADLYVRYGQAPNTSEFDQRPYLSGNNETVASSSPQGGDWYIGVRGYGTFEGVTLTANY